MLSESDQLGGRWIDHETKRRLPNPLQEWPSVAARERVASCEQHKLEFQHGVHVQVEVQPHPLASWSHAPSIIGRGRVNEQTGNAPVVITHGTYGTYGDAAMYID